MLGIAFFSFLLVVLARSSTPWLPDEVLNVTQMIQRRGYPVEEHRVETADGFYLSMQRLPRPGKQPVLLQHGFLDCSTTWVINEPYESLAFILYDAGYDVWLGNNRGNIYSMTGPRFHWNFSWDEMARYDMPALHDRVIETTGQRLIHIGHSEGTQQAFAGFSINATLSSRCKLFIALAPVTALSHQDSLLIGALARVPFKYVLDVLGNEAVPPIELGIVDFILEWLVPGFCQAVGVFCKSFIIAVAGCNSFSCDLSNLNATRVPVYSAHLGGSSMQNLNHYMQIARKPGFSMYDFGSAAANQQRYGQPVPPLYNLSNMHVDLACFVGAKDAFADPADVGLMLEQLPKEPVFLHNEPNYTHIDPIWAVDAHKRIYPGVLALVKQYAAKQ